MFNAEEDRADAAAFVMRSHDDRHHFRFIISPEDAAEMTDLKAFARDLAAQMERDLGTKLEGLRKHWRAEARRSGSSWAATRNNGAGLLRHPRAIRTPLGHTIGPMRIRSSGLRLPRFLRRPRNKPRRRSASNWARLSAPWNSHPAWPASGSSSVTQIASMRASEGRG